MIDANDRVSYLQTHGIYTPPPPDIELPLTTESARDRHRLLADLRDLEAEDRSGAEMLGIMIVAGVLVLVGVAVFVARAWL